MLTKISIDCCPLSIASQFILKICPCSIAKLDCQSRPSVLQHMRLILNHLQKELSDWTVLFAKGQPRRMVWIEKKDANHPVLSTEAMLLLIMMITVIDVEHSYPDSRTPLCQRLTCYPHDDDDIWIFICLCFMTKLKKHSR